MKINLNNFPCQYGKVVSNPTVRVGTRSFTLENRSGFEAKLWEIDEVVFNGRTESRCDFAIEIKNANGIYYWVELKGKDISKACSQILSTVNLVEVSKNAKQEARIITTGVSVPEIRTNEYKRLDKYIRSKGGRVQSYTNHGKETI